MNKKRISDEPYECVKSNHILIHPDGSVNESILEEILYSIHIERLPKSKKVLVTREKRVRGFNQHSPEWESVTMSRTVSQLQKLYSQIKGYDYVAPSPEVHNRMQDLKYRRGYT